ncbi:hypothetical protein L917_19515 [Phytophthora nicotianae]|uniref:Uncharacterized protein n=1 Tax=Phytophthora nicotianae TaxID=4792 RepID=W2K5V4_PHYNI|nr:hypothetical protein L917_19515 [Phytophthora nicotianae]
MELSAKLRDAEQQLTRALQAIELHVERANASLRTNGGQETPQSEVQELVERVERVQNQLETATSQLVALAKRSVEKQPEADDGDDTETEDEMEIKEEPQISIKVELTDEQAENCGSSSLGVDDNNAKPPPTEVVGSGSVAEMTESRTATTIREPTISGPITCDAQGHNSYNILDRMEERRRDIIGSYYSFIIYTSFASNAMKKGNTTRIDAEKLFSCMNSKELGDLRKCVHKHMLGINQLFIKNLTKGNISRESAEQFAAATSLAVSLLIRDKLQQFYELQQVIEDLSHILGIAKDSLLVPELSPIEKSRDELYKYSHASFRDSFEEMSSFVELEERHRYVEANHLPALVVSLLRKFIWDCVNYSLQQQVVAAPPRTESQWERFTEIGLSLARLMNSLSTADVSFKISNPSMNCTRLKAFNTRFPGRIPATLFANWCCLVRHNIEVPLSDWSVKPFPTARRSIQHVQTAKRKLSASSDVNPRETKRAATDNRETAALADTPKDTPLQQFLSVAKETRQGLESTQKSSSEELTISSKWLRTISKLFVEAVDEFLLRTARHDIDEETTAAFLEAAALATSFIIACTDRKRFKRPWIMQILVLLGEIHGPKKKIESSPHTLESIGESWNRLLMYVDNRFPNYLVDIVAYLKRVEGREGPEVGMSRLLEIIDTLAEKLEKVCSYGMLREELRRIKPWPEELWQTFNQAWWSLLNWTDIVLEAQLPPPEWIFSMRELLEDFGRLYPHRIPKPVFMLVESMKKIDKLEISAAKSGVEEDNNNAVQTVTATTTTVVTKIRRISPSDEDAVLRESTHWRMTRFLEMATELQQTLNESEETVSVSRTAIQSLLARAQEANTLIEECVARGVSDERITIAFGGVTKTVTKLLLHCPRDEVDREQLKEV